jgi:uncharacterized glyoxalase superfamily protein PhnB
VVTPPGEAARCCSHCRRSSGPPSATRIRLLSAADDFWRDYRAMTAAGVKFTREPSVEPYGTVAVFEDLYGNLWDFVERKDT